MLILQRRAWRAAALRLAAALRRSGPSWAGPETHYLLPLCALPLLAAIWGAALHIIDAERRLAQRHAQASASELLDTYEAQVIRSLGRIDLTLKVIRYGVDKEGAADALSELRQQNLLPSAQVFTVGVADRDGAVVASNHPGAPASVAGQFYFAAQRDGLRNGAFVYAPQREIRGGEASLTFALRRNDAAGRFAGIVMLAAPPRYFTNAYEHGRQGERGLLGLFDADGAPLALRLGERRVWERWDAPLAALDTPLAAPRHGAAGEAAAAAAVSAPAPPAPAPAPAALARPSPWDGVPRFSAARRLPAFGLSIAVGLAEDEQMAGFEQRRRSILWQSAAASVLLAVIVALAWAWSWQGARIRRLARRAEATYAAATEANLDAFFVLHSVRGADGAIVDFRIVAANRRAERMTGLDRQTLCRQTLCALMPSCHETGLFGHLVHVADVGGVHQAEWENSQSHGRPRWLHRQLVGVEDGVVAIVRDISARKRDEARIWHMAHHDALTGLPNRVRVGERLEQAIAQAARGEGGGGVLVAFIDLDSFKLVNDGLGHVAGDELLRAVAGRMQRWLHRGDLVGRFGGDEFVLVLPCEAKRARALVPLLDQVREAVTAPLQLAGQEVQVGCSIGVAVYPFDGADAATLLRNADVAMYQAKAAGRNNCQFYRPEMHTGSEQKLALLEGLRNALEEGQFRVLYQPKVDLRSGLIIGAEALARWQHPQQGLISPLRFIPLAEESGLIVPIGAWVLQTACRQSMAWRRAGLAPISISVNVSPRQFDDPALVGRVEQALVDSGLAPEHLELEVTESLIMRDLTLALVKMGELKAMGLSLSIDDFGTGHSSLSTLKSFPISRLKIDQSFVRDLASSTADQVIARAIILLSHQLQLRVIAEGVETVQQRDFLRENGCDEMQGYLFSQPVSGAELQAMLELQAGRLIRPRGA